MNYNHVCEPGKCTHQKECECKTCRTAYLHVFDAHIPITSERLEDGIRWTGHGSKYSVMEGGHYGEVRIKPYYLKKWAKELGVDKREVL